MKYLDYKEQRKHGTFDFPVAYYHVTPAHPRYHMSCHWHPEFEIIRVIGGELSLTLNGKDLKAGKDEILFIHAGILHSGTPEDCIYECIVFDLKSLIKENNICSRLMEDIVNNKAVINPLLPTGNLDLLGVCNSLFESMAQKKTGFEFVTEGSLYHLLGIILEHGLFGIPQEKTHKSRQRISEFKNVLTQIEKKYASSLTLDDLAKAAGMTPKYFCRFFREMTQRSPIDYLNYFRIECACTELAVSNAKITEIALDCGFNDISYFIKTFKKYMSVTPRQYRKIHHSEITP